MANGTDAEEFMALSKVRAGLKREFAFALKSQSEISSSLAKTRIRTPVRVINEVQESPISKRFKKLFPVSKGKAEDIAIVKLVVESEGDLNSDIVDASDDDDNRNHLDESLRAENTGLTVIASDDEQKYDCDDSKGNAVVHDKESDLTTKTPNRSALNLTVEETIDFTIFGGGDVEASSSKSSLKTVPRVLKELLATGFLEGLSVEYIRGSKSKKSAESGLPGVVKGSGIICFCEDCNGDHVVTPTVFELHAGSSNKRPTDYIHLENGKTLRDVLNACKECKLDDLEATIRNFVGHASEAKTSKRVTKASDRLQEELVLTSSDNAKKAVPSGNKSDGRLTREHSQLLKRVFDPNLLPKGAKVGYYVYGQELLNGYIAYKKDERAERALGIVCLCCKEVVSPSQFEAHAGSAFFKNPSLHELSELLCREGMLLSEDNDDICSICHQHGDLLACDGCTRSFHKACLASLEVPDGNCIYCQNMFQMENDAKSNANAKAAGRVAGVDPIEEIKSRCVRIMKPRESENGGCAICRRHDFAEGGFSSRTVMLCDQCEKEFHVGCLREYGMQDLKELPEGKWFCSSGCDGIYSVLQQMIEDGEQQIPDCLLDITKQKHAATGSKDVELDIKWRLLNGKMSSIALLSETVSVFHSKFDPIILPDSKQDIIPHMVYGRNVKDKELGGMYCAVLIVNSVIVSAGVFRILGKDIAELPLVATSSQYEKLGYFQVLYSCIEKLLGELDVKYLWLPAATEAKPLWTNKFGFSEFPAKEFDEFKKQYSLMLFDRTCALRKSVPKNHAEPVQLQATNIPENHMEAPLIAPINDAIIRAAFCGYIGLQASVNPQDVEDTAMNLANDGGGSLIAAFCQQEG